MSVETELKEPRPEGTTRLLPIITGFFVGILVISNILATKMVQLGPLVFDGGTLLFPLSYIFGDILTEVYGYKESRKVIWTGLCVLAVVSLNIWLIGSLPSISDWPFQKDFDNILAIVPRIVVASAVAYFAGEYSNSVILSKLKVLTKGKMLWVRTIGSTVVGELADTVLFVTIAFAGSYSIEVLVAMVLSNYLFKTGVEVAFTPITYRLVRFVKKREKRDTYDIGVSYNPLPMGK